MNDGAVNWEERIAALWRQIDAMEAAQFVAAIDALAAERPAADAAALFERACARDSVGFESGAEGFYRAALAAGQLDPYRQARASIQLGSTLRILGQLDESERLLAVQLDRYAQTGYGKALYDETRAILALTYLAQGRAVEAACLALETLAPHLSRYQRSVAGNALEIRNAALIDAQRRPLP
ncbi:tetratricopeptide repeat protein [Collimonas sp. NPDC087041]|uniref:tetratricopeptide repeat protein n=1 Tax=Collimonas sp. NPDC087041 TaxID=3363960 RepID=UPI0038000071